MPVSQPPNLKKILQKHTETRDKLPPVMGRTKLVNAEMRSPSVGTGETGETKEAGKLGTNDIWRDVQACADVLGQQESETGGTAGRVESAETSRDAAPTGRMTNENGQPISLGLKLREKFVGCGWFDGNAAPRHATPRHAMPRHATQRCTTPRHTMLRHAAPRRATPHYATPAW